MYKNIQNSSLELEKLETENKALESQADDQARCTPHPHFAQLLSCVSWLTVFILQLQVLESIEGHNDQVREDLETHIASIQRSITGYETSYNANMQVLGTMTESLMSILRNVSIVVA
jgi:poly-gamma-glutamate capsule biosynthesis protein CapA/YwtB (metallophosphatase superfamily)